ncbi:hypothetical protein R5R35_009768 [Gryllus longicercus]|uniref:MADF domain-containing protein n=1 Tax=Gryllus longicercus TaxID=2509291 RepID=A0AAN9VQ15_9ORTH
MSDADDPCNSSSNAPIEVAPPWPSTKGRFNPEAFIADIKEHPVIWDLNLDEYKVRGMRALAWDTICHKYIVNYAEKSVKEKRAAVAMLQTKWKNIRIAFRKELARQKKSKNKDDPESLERKPYVYFEILSFLTDSIGVRRSKRAVDKPKLQRTTALLISSGYPISKYHSAKKKKKSNIFIENHNKILVNNSQNLNDSQKHQGGDADRNFVLSLIPHLKQIPEEYKLDVQSEILMTIKKYKLYGRQMYNQPYVYCTPSFSLPHHPISSSQITQSTPAQPPVAPPSSPTAVSKNAPSPVISKAALGSTDDDDDPVIDNIV